MTEGRDEQELHRGIDVSLEDGSSIDGFLPEDSAVVESARTSVIQSTAAALCY